MRRAVDAARAQTTAAGLGAAAPAKDRTLHQRTATCLGRILTGAVTVGALVVLAAGPAGAYEVATNPPAGQINPGDTITVTITPSEGCDFVTRGETEVDVSLLDPEENETGPVPASLDPEKIVFSTGIENNNHSIGQWTFLVDPDGEIGVVEACPEGPFEQIDGSYIVTLGGEPDPIVAPLALAVLAPVGLAAGLVVRRRGRSGPVAA
jgi:hypothetical protein